MNQKRVLEALRESMEEVLERVAFRCLEEDPSDPAPGASLYVASVTFHGAAAGSVTVWVEADEARDVAASFLGADAESLAPEDVHDAAGEIANMVCGGALCRLVPDGVVDLDKPSVTLADARPVGSCGLQMRGDLGRVGALIEVAS